jgi:hypothetical protein
MRLKKQESLRESWPGSWDRGVRSKYSPAITTPVLAGMEPFPKSAQQKFSAFLRLGILRKYRKGILFRLRDCGWVGCNTLFLGVTAEKNTGKKL